MVRTIIVDDDPKNIRILRRLLEEFCPDVNILAEAKNANKAIQFIEELQPDLVLMDIEMPYDNAFDLLDRIMPVEFEIIFITAFDAYMQKAFKYNVLDYLLKPISIGELKDAVTKAAKKIQNRQLNLQLDSLLSRVKKKQVSLQKIALPYKDELIVTPVNNIVRLEAKGAYTTIYTRDGVQYTSSKNIKEYEEILPEDIFFRIHNTHVINLNDIKKYHKGRGGYIEMEDGTIVEVAIRRKDEFLARLGYK